MSDEARPTIEEARRLVGEIKWKSVDRDNMEFEARASCFQRDALRTLLESHASMTARVEEAVRLAKKVR